MDQINQIALTAENVEKVKWPRKFHLILYNIVLRLIFNIKSISTTTKKKDCGRVLRNKSAYQRVQATTRPMAKASAKLARSLGLLVATHRHVQIGQLSILRCQLFIQQGLQVLTRRSNRPIRCAKKQATWKIATLREHNNKSKTTTNSPHSAQVKLGTS